LLNKSKHPSDSDLSAVAARWVGGNGGNLPDHVSSCTPCLDRFLQMLNPARSVRRSKIAGSRDWFIWNCGPKKIFKFGGNVFPAGHGWPSAGIDRDVQIPAAGHGWPSAGSDRDVKEPAAIAAMSVPPAVRGIRRLDGKPRRGDHVEFEWMDFRFSLSWNRARSRLNISCLDGPFSNPEIIFDLVQGVSKNRDAGKLHFFASDHLPLAGGRNLDIPVNSGTGPSMAGGFRQSLDVPPKTSRLRLRLKHPTGATVEGRICLR